MRVLPPTVGNSADPVRETVGAVYRSESRRVLATLIRLLGDFELAEEALHDAFAAAIQQWPEDGIPANPRAWLVTTGRFKAIDSMRRRARFDASVSEFARRLDTESAALVEWEEPGVEDDRLRLIFICCHPALPAEARVALTLREVCGLTTEEIARAFLSAAPTVAQRIVRAKTKIRDARIPYQVPSQADLPERLNTVLQVIYLVFNEGYSASSGTALTRSDLAEEAIRLGRLLMELLPEPEVMGLLALMLLHQSRHGARTSPVGDLILLDDQDRSLWNRDQIAEGCPGGTGALVVPVRSLHPPGRDRGSACRGPHGFRDRLGPDRGFVSPARARGAIAHRRAEPCRRGGDARRPFGRTCLNRRHSGARRFDRLPSCPFGQG